MIKLEDRHLMVDIETYSTRSNGLIRSIGAIHFTTAGQIGNAFHNGIDVESCVLAGMHIDPETVQWWKKQPENLERLQGIGNLHLEVALRQFKTFACGYGDVDKLYVWSHGSNFDLVLLDNAYNAVGLPVWWKHKNVRDTRTLFALSNYEYKAEGGHDALQDATNQAAAVVKCLGAFLIEDKNVESFLKNNQDQEKWKLPSEK